MDRLILSAGGPGSWLSGSCACNHLTLDRASDLALGISFSSCKLYWHCYKRVLNIVLSMTLVKASATCAADGTQQICIHCGYVPGSVLLNVEFEIQCMLEKHVC